MRDETTCAAYMLAVAVVLGVLHVGWLGHGRGGFTLMLGSIFLTGVLWAMVSLRSLASGHPLGPELDDGLTAMAVTAFLFAVLPIRAANFALDGAVDDFTRAYLPVSLGSVGAVLVARQAWPARRVRLVWLRWLVASSVGAFALAALVKWVVGGAGADEFSLNAGVLALLCALGGTVLHFRRSAG